MNDRDTSNAIVRGYLDELLQPTPPAPDRAATEAAPDWQLCVLGRLRLLLPAAALQAPVPCAGLQAPPDWHLARVPVGATARRVIDLARCIAPDMAAAPPDTLLPVAGSPWALAVTGQPQPFSLPEDAIEWRQQRHSRPWLAGMSRDRRHMALDVHGLIAQATGDAGSAMEEPSS